MGEETTVYFVNRKIEDLQPQARELALFQITLISKHNLPLRIFETKRTKERQEFLYKKGGSQTLNSPHLYGYAWDVAIWDKDARKWNWQPIHWFFVLGLITMNHPEISKKLVWGADWDGRVYWFNEKFVDLGHYEVKGWRDLIAQ